MNGNEAINAVAGAVGSVSNIYQIIFTVITCVFGLLGVWLWRRTAESKELIALKEQAEIERTKVRTSERDRQIEGIKSEHDAKIAAISSSLNNHLDAHRDRDIHIQTFMDKLDARVEIIQQTMAKDSDITKIQADMKTIQGDVKKTEMKLAVICTVLEERDKRRESV